MLSRTQIRQFLAVVDSGSFTRAANALNIAQPSLSGGIAELERQLGTRLFVRERRRIRLTPAGNALLPLARGIERDFHLAERQVGSLPVPARPVRLGVLDTVSTGWLERAVAAYAGEEPLELTEGSERELSAALASGSIDLALTLVGEGAEALLEEDYCLALPASHPLAGEAWVEAADVAGDTMIARRACEVLADTSRFFTRHGVRPLFALRSANDDRVMAMVRAGLGVTVAPRSLGCGGVAMVNIRGFRPVRRIGLVFGSLAAPHPEVRAALAGAAAD
ncbi:LysR family transcriptional regulator [Novosphingobium sp.]|uniref:LysR family transcriptional regulator n=1 Tax=Novosphingobium sp. TaxID=1874826 RepID=UPI0027356D3A|nr:LysR family transcriptional regulator [Novosphingobium sp.]MDP3906552.1 LysR family transcriptional regulator [Novosphingobium sp.]